MIGPCTHCWTLNDFTAEPLDTCWKCGATNITNQNFKIYSKVSEMERVDEGIREPKPQIQYPKPKGTCSRCKRKNMTLYSVKNKLCQNCYRVDLERRKSEKLKRRLGS
jgi:protein-arginine kinase activator protein McsA